MDKNQATGLILFAAVLLGYSIFFAKTPEPIDVQEGKEATEKVEAAREADVAEDISTFQLPDSLLDLQALQKFGAFAALTKGEANTYTIENELLAVEISSQGGEIKRVRLKEFTTWNKQPLYLLDENSSSISYTLPTRQGDFDLNEFFFQAKSSTEERDGVTLQVLTFTAQADQGSITRTYRLAPNSYALEKGIAVDGFRQQLMDGPIAINWEDRLKKLEADIEESRRKTNANWFFASDSYDYFGVNSNKSETLSEPVRWASFSQRFFTSAILADGEPFLNGRIAQDTPSDTLSVKNMSLALALPLAEGQNELRYYFGPNNYKILKTIAPSFEKNVDMGYFFVSWVNKYIIVNLFQFLERYVSNYGVIIILIVLIIKLFLFPLTYKSYMGMAKMRVIKPEIDELKEKYGDDPTKMQTEQMKLFSQLGVSPISGCLPLLLQMPFLFAMFFFFPNSIELRGESFLWAHDLSTYDSIINLPFTIPFYGSHVSLFTLLMTVSQIAYTKFNNQLSTQTGPLKNLGYIMPIGFMFILNSFPAALSFYYFVSNMVTFGQQALIKLFVDDAKVRQKVEENKKKNVNKKKSKFQQRLEDAMRAAEEQKQANKKKK
ncbi:membrane protein insertase [Nitritalea halalkaliphila LW7]|uniref:Membrane protein insertase YidC n=1 Tax=Nitritalea halalkaliphila LW7 TaxID=1189621 RepID=I5BU31_9BACT|nr:membrane protein insertase YidC [Nitritalea halalkaliphila]EIM73083.1 membrane protein insertase [Nitritalea halalkaliphila LW7]